MERKMRLLKCTTKYEESWKKGEFKKILGPQTVVWEGEVEETELNPDGRWFWGQALDLPRNSEENRGERRLGRPQDGDEDFSYVLQEKIGGAWAYVAHVTPWEEADQIMGFGDSGPTALTSPYWTDAHPDEDDWDQTDPEFVRRAQAFESAMER